MSTDLNKSTEDSLYKSQLLAPISRDDSALCARFPDIEQDLDVVILGAGPAGCWTALRLLSSQPNLRLRLLESSSVHGGKALTWREEGFCLERGPECFHAPPDDPAFQWLLKELPELELQLANPSASNRYIVKDGRLFRLGLKSLLGGQLISYTALLRALAEPLSRRAPQSEESLAEFGRRRLGAELTGTLFATMAQGIFAGDPEKLSLRACFPRLAELDRRGGLILGALRAIGTGGTARRMVSFRGGLGAMQDAIHSRLGSRIQTDFQVLELRRVTTETNSSRFEVLGRDSHHRRTLLRTPQLILATPSWQSSQLLESMAPRLAEVLARQPYVGMAVIALGFQSAKVARPLPGFGALVGPDRRPAHQAMNSLGILASSTIFPDRSPPGTSSFRVLMGGARNPEALKLRDDQRIDLALADLRELIGLQGSPDFLRAQSWKHAIPQYHRGHSHWLADIDQELSSFPGLHLTGNSYLGPGLVDTLRAALATADNLKL